MGVDTAVSEWFVDWRCGLLDPVMLTLSAWWLKDLIAPLIALTLDLRARQPPWRAVTVGLATLLAALLANGLKGVLDRQRPFADGLWSAIGSHPASASMPSGHAATAFATAVALGLVAPHLRLAALAVAALVAVSRVYLGVHFASDVVAGAVLGTLVAFAVCKGLST